MGVEIQEERGQIKRNMTKGMKRREIKYERAAKTNSIMFECIYKHYKNPIVLSKVVAFDKTCCF